MIKIKRVYEAAEAKDGYRVLVDGLWPRGLKKSDVRMDEWAKELAPTPALRKWFSHRDDRWEEFQVRYAKELRQKEAQEHLKELSRRARKSTVTLLYGSRDEEHNQAAVLKSFLEKKSR